MASYGWLDSFDFDAETRRAIECDYLNWLVLKPNERTDGLRAAELAAVEKHTAELLEALSMNSITRALIVENSWRDVDIDDLRDRLELLHDAVAVTRLENPIKQGRPKSTYRRRKFAQCLKMRLEDADLEPTQAKNGLYSQCLKAALVASGEIESWSDDTVKKLIEAVLKESASSRQG